MKDKTEFNMFDTPQPVSAYLNQPLKCTCGRTHYVPIKAVQIRPGAIQATPELVKQYGYQRPYILCDAITYQTAGAKLEELLKDEGIEKVVIGKKLRKPQDAEKVMTLEEYYDDFEIIGEYLRRAVKERCWSAVELVYNHYYNLSSVKQEIKRIYPLAENEAETEGMLDDFVVEADTDTLLEDMTISYLTYEMKIAAASAYASENIMRQNATTESLKKLDEREAEELRIERKERTYQSFRKTIDSYIKQKSLDI